MFLGDSYVMGSGARAEDRMGVFLEGFLAERAQGFSGRIECLHLGIASWDIVAECAVLCGVLADVQPDLVIQLTIRNDLDDPTGVRGFGVQARYNPRERFAAAARSLRELALDLVRVGCEYVLVCRWFGGNPTLARALAPHLDAQAQAWLPAGFDADPALAVSAKDPHWNRRGHERFAELVYGCLRERGLLSELALAPWPEAEELARTALARGLAELTGAASAEARRPSRPVAARLDFRAPLPVVMGQVHDGIGADGLVSPYASICMATEGGAFVRVRGRSLDSSVLDGVRVQVFGEEAPVGELVLAAGEPLDARFALPREVAERPFVSVRFVSQDWIYAGPWRQHCVVFDLEELAIER